MVRFKIPMVSFKIFMVKVSLAGMEIFNKNNRGEKVIFIILQNLMGRGLT